MTVRPASPAFLAAVLVAAVVVGPAMASLAPSAAAVAQSTKFVFQVDSTTDAHDANPSDGVCRTSFDTCTLRAALEEADALPVGSRIKVDVPAGTYDLSLGSLEVTANTVTVSGAGRAVTEVTAGGASRVLFVGAGATATVEGLTITHGNAGNSGYGGGIESVGTLTVDHAAVTSNRAAAGGGLANAGGTMTVEHSQISDNTDSGYGGAGINNGGVRNVPGTVTVEHSTLVDDDGGGDGGGILNGQNGHPATAGSAARAPVDLRSGPLPVADGLVLTVTDSTFSEDQGGNGGGGVANDGGTFSVTGSSFDANRGGQAVGGAISSGGGSLMVSSSTLDGNYACYGGGIEMFTNGTSGTHVVTGTTLSDNQACVGGGLDVSGSATVTQSTLSGNKAPIAAAMEVEGSTTFSLSDSTVSGNTSDPGQAVLETYACSDGTVSFVTFSGNSNALGISCPDVTVTGTILADSTDGPNCVGAALKEPFGYNLDSGSSCALGRPTDLSSTKPRLRALADNGGPTMTMALKAGSPAIDHGGTAATGCPAADQRGVPRPQGPACDIGAFERRVAAAAPSASGGAP
jgi:large repetitive protein